MYPVIEIPTMNEIADAFYDNDLQIEFAVKSILSYSDWYLIDGKIYIPYFIPEAFGIYTSKEMIFEYDENKCYIPYFFRGYNKDGGFYFLNFKEQENE